MTIEGTGADSGATATPTPTPTPTPAPAPAEAAPAAAAVEEDTSFETAFDTLTAPEPKPDAKAGEEGVPAAEEPKAEPKAGEEAAPAAAAAEPKPDKDAKPGKEAKPAAGADGPKADEPKPAATADDILAGLEKLIKPAAPAAGADEPKPDEKPLYNDEETAALEAHHKEWGDVAKGEALVRRAEYKELLAYVFAQVADFVKPIMETTTNLAERSHLGDIQTNIPDYSDQLRDDVTEWVKTQPAYLQTAYNQVINEGTVDEVKDLVERYRGATGKAAPAAAAAEPKPNGKDNELSGAAKQAAAALAPVESKRSVIEQQGDPTDFDNAWKQAAVLLETG